MTKFAQMDINGAPTAFYDDGINTNIPSNAVQITDDTWLDCLNNIGARTLDFTGAVTVIIPAIASQQDNTPEAQLAKINDLKIDALTTAVLTGNVTSLQALQNAAALVQPFVKDNADD